MKMCLCFFIALSLGYCSGKSERTKKENNKPSQQNMIVPDTVQKKGGAGNTPVDGSRIHCPLEIVPGKSIGAIRIGMKLDNLATVLDSSSGNNTPKSIDIKNTYSPFKKDIEGIYRITHNEQNEIVGVTINILKFPDKCVMMNGVEILKSKDIRQFATYFQDCEEIEPGLGGAFTHCNKGGISVGESCGGNEMTITVRKQDEN